MLREVLEFACLLTDIERPFFDGAADAIGCNGGDERVSAARQLTTYAVYDQFVERAD